MPAAPKTETDEVWMLRGPQMRKKGPLASETETSRQKYSWKEVATHNTEDSAWIVIRGVVYDMTMWLDRHPGGKELLLLHAGRECTDTMDSYHPFTSKPGQIIGKFEIGSVDPDEKTEFPMHTPDSGFYKTCKERVGAYFNNTRKDPKDPMPGLRRMIFVFTIAGFCFSTSFGLIANSLPMAVKCCLACLFGICQALPLLHVMHDASHAAYSHSSSVWSTVGHVSMDWFAGGSLISWLNQHVVGHHVHTNVAGSDPDMPIDMDGDIRRVFSRQSMKPIYKWQHLYLPPLYAFLGLKFRVQDFTCTLYDRSNGPIRTNPPSVKAWVVMLSAKAFWAFYRIWMPLCWIGLGSTEFWSLFFIVEFTTGWWLAFNFQVSHVSTECDYPCGDSDDSMISDEWAISQVKSSVDYAHGNPVTTFLCGALNYQVTHHLFPSVSQYHYPAIAPIIQKVCQEYGVKYTVLPDFASALSAHFAHLKIMGAKGKQVNVHMG